MSHLLLRIPPLDAIRGFVAVARRMSITMAAQDLCLTQSAVSRQIQSLEEFLGTPLLVRKHRAIALTETGEELFRLASPWLDRLVEFTRSVAQEGRHPPVTITASIGVTSLWILPRLGAFQAMHPNIDVRVAANNRILDLKLEGIDLAIRYCRAADAPNGSIRLFGEEVVPVASKQVAASAFCNRDDLLDHVFLELDERPRPWCRWSDWLTASGMADAKPKAYLHFNQYDQVIQAAIEGHGVALGRLPLVLPMLKDGRLVAQANTEPGVSDFAYWLVRTDDAPRDAVRVFADWLIREVRLTAESLAGATSRFGFPQVG
jgi:DNA-binding transcriptional LysR family regulator